MFFLQNQGNIIYFSLLHNDFIRPAYGELPQRGRLERYAPPIFDQN